MARSYWHERVLSRTLKIQEAFRFMGVTHLFTTDEKARPSEQGVTCKDQNGAEIVVWPLPNAHNALPASDSLRCG